MKSETKRHLKRAGRNGWDPTLAWAALDALEEIRGLEAQVRDLKARLDWFSGNDCKCDADGMFVCAGHDLKNKNWRKR